METVRTNIYSGNTPAYGGYYGSLVEYVEIGALVPPGGRAVGKECASRFTSSLEQSGFLRPLMIDSSFRIVDGAKRYAAAILLGYERAPCVFYPTPLIFEDDMLIESLVRDALTFFQYAEKVRTLTEKHLYSQDCVASAVGRSQSFIANKLRLLSFTDGERELIEEARLTERHCRALLKIKDGDLRREALVNIINSGMNVSAAEYYVSTVVPSGGDLAGEFLSKLRALVKSYETSCGVSASERRSDDGSVFFGITVRKNVSRETFST